MSDNLLEYLLADNFFIYKFPQPQYLGAKYKHVHWIGQHVPSNVHVVLDAFAGSQSVAFYFKQSGFTVYSNDFLNFNNQIGKSLIENKTDKLLRSDIEMLFSKNLSPTYYNLMQNLYTDIFFTRKETEVIDTFRSNIAILDNYKQNLALTIMNRSLTRKVTMGHFAHNKALDYANNSDRIKRNRNLIRPIQDIFIELVSHYNNAVFDNKQDNKSFNLDAIQFIRDNKHKADLLYLDPPYCGSHADYQSFYHLLETYTEYWKDKDFKNSNNRFFPKIFSGFDTKKDITTSFEKLFEESKDIPYWLISYNDRSYPSKDCLLDMINVYKNVRVEYQKYHENVGGKGSVKGSSELLFVCSPKLIK